MPINRETFQDDSRGRTFSDVSENQGIPFDAAIAFFKDKTRIRRMIESELHHGRPALSGVIIEFEELPEVREFFESHEPRQTIRFRQAVGVMTRIVMLDQGWEKTGIKGSMGTRSTALSDSRGTNSGGLSKWFSRTERYRPAEDSADREAWDRRNMKG